MTVKLAAIIGMGLILQPPSQASTLDDIQQLPAPLQGCWTNGDCSIDTESSFESGGIAAFRYLSADFSGYLFRYALVSPSVATNVYMDGQNPLEPQPIETNVALSGNVWLQVADSYSVSASSRPLTLYREQISPSQQAILPRSSYADEYPNVLNFELSASSLLASSAYHTMTFNGLDFSESGDLIAAEPLLTCLADGCGTHQELNLIGMSFVQAGDQLLLQFAANDGRAKLYSEAMRYDNAQYGSLNQRDWYVQPVPLPAAWLVWLSGLGLIAGRCTKTVKRRPSA